MEDDPYRYVEAAIRCGDSMSYTINRMNPIRMTTARPPDARVLSQVRPGHSPSCFSAFHLVASVAPHAQSGTVWLVFKGKGQGRKERDSS